MSYKKPDPFYEIVLPDYAGSSFCTFTKSYHGTLADIRELMEALSKNNVNGQHNELLRTWREWEQGNTVALHRPVYREHQLLTPEKMVAAKEHSLENITWQHTNIWDSIRNLKADRVSIHQVILAQGDWYIRCIRPVFENLMVYRRYLSPPQWLPIGNRFWGFPGMMVWDGKYTYPRLYIEQKSYKSLEETIADLNDESKIDYSKVCDEIFGDG